MKTIMSLMLVVISLLSIGCTRIEMGTIGIKKTFSGQIEDFPATSGFEVTLFDSVIIVDATQVRNIAQNIRAKDVDGVLFSDIDVQATYNLRPEGAVKFYKQTKEVDRLCGEGNGDCENVLGYKVVNQELINATGKAINKFKASDVNTNKQEIEKTLKDLLTTELETLFPGAFEITNVNINSAQLDPSVERVLQAQALLDSEKRLASAKKEIQDQQLELLKNEMVEMKVIAQKAGIPVGELLKFRNDKERTKVLSEFAKNSSNVQVQVKEKD